MIFVEMAVALPALLASTIGHLTATLSSLRLLTSAFMARLTARLVLKHDKAVNQFVSYFSIRFKRRRTPPYGRSEAERCK